MASAGESQSTLTVEGTWTPCPLGLKEMVQHLCRVGPPAGGELGSSPTSSHLSLAGRCSIWQQGAPGSSRVGGCLGPCQQSPLQEVSRESLGVQGGEEGV